MGGDVAGRIHADSSIIIVFEKNPIGSLSLGRDGAGRDDSDVSITAVKPHGRSLTAARLDRAQSIKSDVATGRGYVYACSAGADLASLGQGDEYIACSVN